MTVYDTVLWDDQGACEIRIRAASSSKEDMHSRIMKLLVEQVSGLHIVSCDRVSPRNHKELGGKWSMDRGVHRKRRRATK